MTAEDSPFPAPGPAPGAAPEPSRGRRALRQGGVGGGDTPRVLAGSDVGLVQLRAAATTFLRARPLVVVPTALLQAWLLHTSAAPAAQARALTAGLALTCTAFVMESLVLSRRQVSRAWLRASLGATLVALGAASTVSGGALSPLLPLLFAPLVTAFAAFGRGKFTQGLALSTVAALVVFAFLPMGVPFPPLPRETAGSMAVISAAAALGLSFIAVTGFAGAYARTAEALERLRVLSTSEAQERARSVETVGAVVAHEIKNPLTAIKGLVQLSAKSPSSEREAKRMEVVLGEVQRIEATLRDYLAFSRPIPELRAEPVALGTLLDDVAVTLEGRAAFSGVTVIRTGSPATVVGDARRLREAIGNLATNAIEAMPSGGTLRLGLETDGHGGAVVAVEDDGPGLAADALDRPFESGKVGGSGLGLLVAKRAAKGHGGALTIERAPSGGALVRMTLPPAPPAEALGAATRGDAAEERST